MPAVSGIREAEQHSHKYPYLGTYNGIVVLFDKKHCGTVVYIPADMEGKTPHRFGEHLECWNEGEFQKFTARVWLENQ